MPRLIEPVRRLAAIRHMHDLTGVFLLLLFVLLVAGMVLGGLYLRRRFPALTRAPNSMLGRVAQVIGHVGSAALLTPLLLLLPVLLVWPQQG